MSHSNWCSSNVINLQIAMERTRQLSCWLNNQNKCSAGGYWEGKVDYRWTSTHFPPIFRAKEVSIKSPILKCKLIGFEVELNIKADIMFLQKKICSLLQRPIFPPKGKKFVSKADHQHPVICTLQKTTYISHLRKNSLILPLVVHSVLKSISVYCVLQNSLAVPTWQHGTEEWQ